MAAADSFVGEALAPSPYKEALERADELDRLCRIYERVINVKNEQMRELISAGEWKQEQLDDAKNCIAHQERHLQSQSEEISRLKGSVHTANVERFEHKMRANKHERTIERLKEDNEFLRSVVKAFVGKQERPTGYA